MHNADPLTYLAIRMALVVGVMAFIAGIARPRWPDRIGIAHSLIAGILVHGFYLGGTAIAIAHSIPAGLSALIPGLQPILTSTIASRWFGERVTPLQWAGLVVGLAGVVLILHGRPMSGEAGWGWLASGVSLVSITLGTLYQRRYCGKIDWRAGNLVQYIGVTIFFAACCMAVREQCRALDHRVRARTGVARGRSVDWIDRTFVLADPALGGDICREPVLLVPAVTAVMAYLLFGERLDAIAIVGMAACAARCLHRQSADLRPDEYAGLSERPSGSAEGFCARRGPRPDQRLDFLDFFFFWGTSLRISSRLSWPIFSSLIFLPRIFCRPFWRPSCRFWLSSALPFSLSWRAS